MKRLGLLMLISLALAAVALASASGMREWRERAMVRAAHADAGRLVRAIAEYQDIYAAPPARLRELEKVGYHERGGLTVCSFDARAGAIGFSLRHRAAHTGIVGHYSAADSAAMSVSIISNCTSVRGQEDHATRHTENG